MPWSRAAAILAGLLLVSSGMVVASAPQFGPPNPALDTQQEFDRVEFRVTVYANGSAQWNFHYERVLENQTERDRFETFAESFVANETTLYTDFQNQSRTLTERGQTTTEREMTADAFTRNAFVTTQLNDVGVVEMAFTWHGFARTDGDRVIVGDVFEGGLYIGPDQSMVIRAGDGLAFQTVEPDAITSAETLAESQTVTWQGERTFPDRHPRVVLGPMDGGPATTVDGGVTDDGTETDEPVTGGGSSWWPLGLVLAVIVVALGVFVYRRRAGYPLGEQAARGREAPALDETALLDDEERITRLLREHGGRMRQSAIVEATEWSKSKVSMVLSEMAEVDEVRKLRVGRENIISLPGHEPDAARSPHEDQE